MRCMKRFIKKTQMTCIITKFTDSILKYLSVFIYIYIYIYIYITSIIDSNNLLQ